MPADIPCPNPDCPHMNYLRRSDDTGTQILLQAIGGLERSMAAQALETNRRLGRIESNVAANAVSTSERLTTHSGEIAAMKAENKSRVDKKWILIAAITGPLATWAFNALGIIKGNKL